MNTDNVLPMVFKSTKSWRHWLENNHCRIDSVWLALKKKKSKIKCITYEDALEEALCFGWIDGIVKSYNEDCFIQRFTPRRTRSIWSLINKNKVKLLIKEGRMTKAGLAKIKEAKKNGLWNKAYGGNVNQELPDDLMNALKNEPLAWKNFSSFSPSCQRQYIAWVSFVKREDARVRRINKVVERSLNNVKPGML